MEDHVSGRRLPTITGMVNVITKQCAIRPLLLRNVARRAPRCCGKLNVLHHTRSGTHVIVIRWAGDTPVAALLRTTPPCAGRLSAPNGRHALTTMVTRRHGLLTSPTIHVAA